MAAGLSLNAQACGKPSKIGLSAHISLYTGFADPISFSCKCGFQRLSGARTRIVHTGESEKRSIMAATKMTQSQLIKELAAAVEVPNKTAKAFTLAYAEMAIKETKKNGVAVLPGIGRLVRVDRKARIGRNPATGEAIKIPAKKVVKFRVAKAVKDAIVPPKAKK
jgi:DNA-binding protein HU-beta